jgi:muramidase (phage lysozyme)
MRLEADIGPTKTLETPKEELTTGSTFAGRYQIIEDLWDPDIYPKVGFWMI